MPRIRCPECGSESMTVYFRETVYGAGTPKIVEDTWRANFYAREGRILPNDERYYVDVEHKEDFERTGHTIDYLLCNDCDLESPVADAFDVDYGSEGKIEDVGIKAGELIHNKYE